MIKNINDKIGVFNKNLYIQATDQYKLMVHVYTLNLTTTGANLQ